MTLLSLNDARPSAYCHWLSTTLDSLESKLGHHKQFERLVPKQPILSGSKPEAAVIIWSAPVNRAIEIA